MIIITSGAYLNSEFGSLLGNLPPAFLPVGNKRLFEWQVETLKEFGQPIVLTIPQNFELSLLDAELLAALGVDVLPVPENISLGQSVVFAINMLKLGTTPVQILHGDTLCRSLPQGSQDLVLTGLTSTHYTWAEFKNSPDGLLELTEELTQSDAHARTVIAGYFAFSDAAELVRCISVAGYDFTAGLGEYARVRPLTRVLTDEWLDFGHVLTYFRSKALHTTERDFNSLEITPRWIEKASTDEDKIRAEAAWYEALPIEFRPYTPQYLGRIGAKNGCVDGAARYRLEYLYNNTLSEIAVFGSLPAFSWNAILLRCREFIELSRSFSPQAKAEGILGVTSAAYSQKTLQRLHDYAQSDRFPIDAPLNVNGRPCPSLLGIADQISTMVEDATPSDMGLMHGDLCFSNILYDFRSDQIRLIDPRGRNFAGAQSIWGDTRYDFAKLSHSVSGLYDFIIAGRYKLNCVQTGRFELSFPECQTVWQHVNRTFLQMQIDGHRASSRSIRAMTIQLFLSMLPLHYDRPDRQLAFIANAARLFADLEKEMP